MCGIAGLVNADGDGRARVQAMLDVIAHRGPDGEGLEERGAVVLGHRRLAILDVTDAGAQPMEWGGRYSITFNGEIYNYIELRDELRAAGIVFHTECDTEVLLAAYAHWGTECLQRFNGMFAFAIHDANERTVFCARDRMGVKPFLFARRDGQFAFASEAKALVAGGAVAGRPSVDAIYEYLVRGYTTGGRSFFTGIEVLQPGHAMLVDERGSARIWQWWTPDTSEDPSVQSAQQWADEIASLLDDAVRLRLRSDVPVGAHLSGGLDSSAVVAAAARHGGAAIHTFTGAFPEDPGSDEREFARQVTARYELTSHEREISVDELAAHFDRIMWHMDEPIAGPGVFPQMLVCDLAQDHGFTVVLGGQGGDELFGGYLRHRALHWRRQAASGGPRQRARAGAELMRLARAEWRRVRRTATRVKDDQLAASFLAQVDPELREDARRSRLSFASARELMRWDLRNYLPALLHVEDRTSMAASIESRTPLLDFRLVERALRIPERFLFTPGEPKPLLRRAVADWLPEQVAYRTDKRGFPTPLHQWQDRPALRALVHELTDPFLHRAASDLSVFSESYMGSRDHFQASELWTVLTVNGWLAGMSAGAFSRPRKQAA